jgi:hypothetical protein
MCSACFPRSSLPTDASLPSTGSSGARSPASSVLSRCYDFLPFVSPHFVAFAWRYLRVHSFFSLPGGRLRRRRPGVVIPVSPAGSSLRKRQDLASSWGTPSVRSPCSVDAGRTAGTGPLRCSSVAPGDRRAKAPAKGLSTLNSMAFGLAVYASQCGLPTPRARLASSRWSDSTAQASRPQGPTERFQSCLLHLIPLSQASCRNRSDPRTMARHRDDPTGRARSAGDGTTPDRGRRSRQMRRSSTGALFAYKGAVAAIGPRLARGFKLTNPSTNMPPLSVSRRINIGWKAQSLRFRRPKAKEVVPGLLTGDHRKPLFCRAAIARPRHRRCSWMKITHFIVHIG